MKTCKRCNQTKDVYEFHKDLKNSDGRHSWCKKCHLEYKRERAKSFPEGTEFFDTNEQRKMWKKNFGRNDVNNEQQDHAKYNHVLSVPKYA